MNVKRIFESGKFLNTKICDLTTIVNTVPLKIAYGIRAFRFIDPYGRTMCLSFDLIQLSIVQSDLGNMIINNEFDQLDDIIINLFKSYYCPSERGPIKISFPEESIERFISTCDNFKGKLWDDIVEDFFMAAYDFIASGIIGSNRLVD